jgi:hypothetical protein
MDIMKKLALQVVSANLVLRTANIVKNKLIFALNALIHMFFHKILQENAFT